MANEEHLKIIAQGVVVWNKWRKTNPEIRPDLYGVDLRGLELSEADFSYTELGDAYLLATNLSRASLLAAKLSHAYLVGANLSGAILCEAFLVGAILQNADLREADLSYASVGYTIFPDADLSTVKGLETVTHCAPSTIGIETIYRSKGKIPVPFLRLAGVSEIFITYMGALVETALEFYSCFISYSSKDQEFAERLHGDLQAQGVRCWFAAEDLKIGDKFRSRIHESIRLYDKLLVVLSRNSIQSPWVEDEVESVLARERRENREVLFPIRLDDTVMETQEAWAESLREIRYIGDFREWRNHKSYKKAFERLLRDLKTEGKNKSAAPA